MPTLYIHQLQSEANNPVFGIEQQSRKDFVFVVLQQCLQVAEDLLRLNQYPAFRQCEFTPLLALFRAAFGTNPV